MSTRFMSTAASAQATETVLARLAAEEQQRIDREAEAQRAQWFKELAELRHGRQDRLAQLRQKAVHTQGELQKGEAALASVRARSRQAAHELQAAEAALDAQEQRLEGQLYQSAP